MLVRKTVVLVKVESTYGVDASPTPSANAILVKNVDIRPTGEVLDRDFLRSSLSPLPFVRGIKEVEVSFETELKGTGTAGSLPSWGWEGTLFRACGMSETVTAGTSVVYAPVSSSFESVTLYVYKDNIFHKVLGCRGTFSLSAEVGKYATVRWTLNGLYQAPTDTTPSAQTFSSVAPPVVLNGGLSLGGYAAIATKIELNMGNELAKRLSVNATGGILEWVITGRKPGGSLDPETVTEATHPFWANWASGASVALNLGPIGSTAGNRITIDAPALQYESLSYGDRSGLLAYEMPFRCASTTGDNEFTITFT